MAHKQPSRKRQKKMAAMVPKIFQMKQVGDGFATIISNTVDLGDATLGRVEFLPETRTIIVQLNISHPGIQAATMPPDKGLLDAYVAEMCRMRATQIREESGGWPWQHEGWLEFVAAWERIGARIRLEDGQDFGLIGK